VYECEDRQIHSHVAQVPFSFTVKSNGCNSQSSIYANIVPVQCVIKARRGKELLVDAKVSVNMGASNGKDVKIISGAVKGGDRTELGAAIQIHYVGVAETLWDIAKRTSTATSEIIKQNPAIADGMKDGDKIVVYRQRIVS